MEKELSRVPRTLSENYNSKLIERLYEVGGSVLIDIIIYLSNHHIKDLFGETWFSIEDFCKKMGYDRTTLQRKLTKEQISELFGNRPPCYVYTNEEGTEIVHPIETLFEASLYKLGQENISFAVKGEDGRSSYNFVQILTKFDIKTDFHTKKKTKKLYYAVLNNQIRDSVFSQYNLGEMQDYRNLPDRKGFRYFYLELTKMIYLIKYKISKGDTPAYTLTVDQLARLFDVNVSESREKKRKVTNILNSINNKLSFTKFKFSYIKGPNQKWPYTVNFEFSEDILNYFDEQFNAKFVKVFYDALLWRYVGLNFPDITIGQDRLYKSREIKDDPKQYKQFLDWAYSAKGKEIKEQVYQENFFQVFGRMPEDFGL